MSLQIRRGTAAELANITPASGELIFTTDTQAVFVGNGVQLGGIPVAVGGGGNVSGVNLLASNNVSAIGNVYGSNVIATTAMSAAGNIYSGAYFFGDGSQLTGVTASGVSAAALTGTTLSSNVTTSTLTSVGTLGNLSVTGIVSASGNVRGNYIIGNGSLLTALTGANVSGTVANATYATSAGSASTASTVLGAAQANITSVGTLSSLTVTANVTGGNLLTAGLISSTGTITASSHLGTVVSASGNITANFFNGNGSALTGIVATTVGTLGSLSVTGSTQTGNLLTAGQVSAVGNITGNYILGNGSQLTGVTASGVNANALTGSTLSSNVTTSSLTSVGTLGNLSVSGNVVASGVITSTGTFRLPSYTSGQRDALTAVEGDMIYNTTLNKIQGYQANALGNITWVSLSVSTYQ